MRTRLTQLKTALAGGQSSEADAILAELLEEPEEAAALRARAREEYGNEGSIEIDSDALLSRSGDPGYYVMAWVWVADQDEET